MLLKIVPRFIRISAFVSLSTFPPYVQISCVNSILSSIITYSIFVFQRFCNNYQFCCNNYSVRLKILPYIRLFLNHKSYLTAMHFRPIYRISLKAGQARYAALFMAHGKRNERKQDAKINCVLFPYRMCFQTVGITEM